MSDKCYHGVDESTCGYAHFNQGSECNQCGCIPWPLSAPKPDDAAARAREIEERHRSDYLHLGQFVAGDRLQERISDALRAERTRALEDAAEMCERDILGGYGHGAARDIRALKGKP